MRYSHLFGKTSKNAPSDADSPNARLLEQGGFVEHVMAGVYSWLPLGLSVLRKVEQIVREEMDALGGQEIFMPSLQPKEYWETTGRWENVDILFKIKSQTDKMYALGCSHEEVVTPLAQKFTRSYKELPFALYQINTKFRDELRAKSGVLRGREFRMKDMYSFHTNQADLEAFYAKTLDAYVRVFKRCGLDVKVVQASGGIFTDKISHEFQALTESGEDTLIACTTCSFGQNSEIATLKEGDDCPNGHGKLVKMKGVEVGNIFDLGTKFTDAFGFDFMNEEGKHQRILMGCYGIGTTRLVGAIVEVYHDAKGIVWPKAVAPFHVHVAALTSKNPEAQAQIEETVQAIERDLPAVGAQVLIDDRDKGAGEKFADADLIGIPLRLVVSEKSLAAGGVEWKERASAEAKNVPLNGLSGAVAEWLKA
ncbi:MAG TPA: aminoacyl--tRNA ligase-related protein [Candidatus Baltobacteraceae bacterium]|nr:aminoacyl--tRNA ligase-related protein [Candidatus Baltobacteraceae bacterium]